MKELPPPKKKNLFSLIFTYEEAIKKMLYADEQKMTYKSFLTKYGKIRITYFINSAV